MMAKPLLLGAHNPHSADPRWALFWAPEGCSGHRLWKMSGLPKLVWKHAFDRMNVLDATEWGTGPDERRVVEVRAAMLGRETLVLGHQARAALGLPTRPWLLPQEEDWGVWRLLPHPSGRCQLYNDPVFRKTVGMLLEEMSRG
jgi:hypothetical protein